MIEADIERILACVIFLIAFFLIYYKKNKLCEEKLIQTKEDNFNQEKEIRSLEKSNNELEKNNEENQSKINSLILENFKLRRKANDEMFSDEILKLFADDKSNKIEYRMCDYNAKKFYEEFGGRIIIGYADYYKDNKLYKEKCSHLWNEITYKNGKVQLIDISNFVLEKNCYYSDYTRVNEIPPEYVTDVDIMHKYLSAK